VEYAEWVPQYRRIQHEFGFDFERETVAAARLTGLLPRPRPENPLAVVAERLKGRDVVVVGLAPRSGAPPLWMLPPAGRRPAIVAADGATQRCLEAGLVPDVIVTDLDGPVPSETAANARGSLVVIHAHGDNLAALDRWVPEFSGPVVGSWAGPPTDLLFDVGGFTDGDRSVFLAEHVGASRILLWGFDFSVADEVATPLRDRKLDKLRWARELLAWLARRSSVPILAWRPDGTLESYGDAASGPSTQ
jgi:uncharacterized Rossmann fold enzyme